MKASEKLINAINTIMARHSGYRLPKDMQNFYSDLNAIGVTTGLISNRQDMPEIGAWRGTTELYYDGDEIENTYMVYSVYEGNSGPSNDYNIYCA